MPKGSTPLGEFPWGPLAAEVGMLAEGLLPSSLKPPWGRKPGASFPYRAWRWRAISSRRPSSLRVLGLIERSDLLDDISAKTPANQLV